MTKREAKIIQEQVNIMERYIKAILSIHVKALKELIDELTEKE